MVSFRLVLVISVIFLMQDFSNLLSYNCWYSFHLDLHNKRSRFQIVEAAAEHDHTHLYPRNRIETVNKEPHHREMLPR